ncbi:Uncharacterized oxidoreductase At4g09670 [Seminavis robusta]|uniref:Uncharacterized oxidoreductase At4g09670 n=1 Tax=Seminavis robusta TaxID=568900 RepID=A0A9N8E9G8_9STRA|nr:Uncharacterized oxidoreductase At4g09670 [Seminavis robusta]|eukprot:Sro695_g188600.1 Uncharacterized oxidoreductase At4g09670 (368) ;mRNA; f:5020-6123
MTGLRVGILGCAGIAKKNTIAILHKESGCSVKAVASRSPEKAQAFVQEMFTSTAAPICLSYEELVHCEMVQAIYIPLPTAFHKEWAIKALQAGKHVLLEKPAALSLQEYQEMLTVAYKHNKFLLDGTMFVHHPRTSKFVQDCQDTSQIGTITRIEAGFSFCGDDDFHRGNIRVKKDGDPLGCVGDLGWYVIRMALLVTDMASVASVQVTDYQLNDEGVPIDVTCLIKFQNKVILAFHSAFTSQFRQYVHVVGTKGWAFIDDWVLPKKAPLQYQVQSMSLTKYDLITEHPCKVETFPDGPVQEVLLWKTFARLSKSIDKNSASEGWDKDDKNPAIIEARKWAEISSTNQQVVDAIMLSVQRDGAKVQL